MNLRRYLFLFFVLAAFALAALPAEAGQFLISGRLHYQDGDPRNDLGLDGSFFRPARLVRITVEDDDDDVFGQGHTDDDGDFLIAVNAPNGEPLRVIADVNNAAVELFANTDWTNDTFRLLIDDFPAGQASDVAFGDLFVPATYHTFEIDESIFNSFDASMSFAAALNVNETILQARDMALDNRDPGETDTLDQVTVEYCDTADPAYYFFSLVLGCARIDGRMNGDGVDDGFVDTTVGHEYAHHLQYEIGAWDGHWESHQNCEEIDTFFNDDGEFAWSEGFADFFGEHLTVTGTNLSRLNPTLGGGVETGCGTVSPLSGDSEQFIAIEGNVIATLWDLVDGLGSGDDAWDRVDGQLRNGGRGFRSIFQIFDKEIGTWDAPDLADFYDAWVGRHANHAEMGQAALDPILNRLSLVPGDNNGVRKMAPDALIEAAPVLPADYSSTYTAGNAKPLTVRRSRSLVNNTGGGTDFIVRVGVSNLGPAITLHSYSLSGSAQQARSATFSAAVRYLSGNGWLQVTPLSGTVGSASLTPVTFRFLPAALDLTAGSIHRAEVDFTFQITRTDGFVVPVTRTVEVVFDYLDGPNSDPDADGLSTQDEINRRGTYPCLDPQDRDSDNDGLGDGEEVNRLGTSPCSRDSDGDGFSDTVEAREPCFQPAVADNRAAPGSDPDGDGLTNAEERLRGTQVCVPDSDGDGRLDGADNCPRIASSQQFPDLDGDGKGDPCDSDADGDGCPKDLDANDFQASPICEFATRDRWSWRRFVVDEDLRLLAVDAFLENLGRPQPRPCGQVDCPPPLAQWMDPRFETTGLVRGTDFGLSIGDGFAWAATPLPDLDGRGKGDLAVSAPWADGTAGIDAGVVLLVAGEDNRELGRLRGTVAGGAFGSSLTLLQDGRLAIGAPGATGKAGQVQVYRLSTQKLERTFTANRADDRFGAALADLGDTNGDGLSDLGVGAPGWGGLGAVYTAGSTGTLSQIALGKATGDRLGERLAKVSDTDADGRPELLAGSPGATRSGRSGTGEVALFGLDGTRYWSQAGRQAGEAFGSALAVNESSKGTELLVGAPGASCETGTRCGRGYLMRSDGSALGIMNGTQSGAEAGRYVAFGPDLDGDGQRSMVLVEPVPTSAAGMGRSQFFER
jgi:hypothetical protein